MYVTLGVVQHIRWTGMVPRAWYLSSGSCVSLSPSRLCHGRIWDSASRQYKGPPVPPPGSGCQRVGMFQEEYWDPTIPLAQTGVKAWDQVHCSGRAARSPSSPLSKPSRQHWRGPAPVTFLSPDPPSDWLPWLLARPLGRDSYIAVGAHEQIANSCCGRRRRGGCGLQKELLELSWYPELTNLSVSSEPEWQFQGHTCPE